MLTHELYKNVINGPILRKKIDYLKNFNAYHIGISNYLGLKNTKSKVTR